MSVKVLGYEVDEPVNVNGTHLVGEITTTYAKLVEQFGEPTFTDADPNEKVNCEWTIDAKVVADGDDEEDNDGDDNDTAADDNCGHDGGEYDDGDDDDDDDVTDAAGDES